MIIISLLLCGSIAATLVVALKKPTTIIQTAATDTITTTKEITKTTTTTLTISNIRFLNEKYIRTSLVCPIFFTATTTAIPSQTVFWSLDNNTSDMYNNYNGVALNSPNYVIGYTGLNSSALSVTRSLSQYVIVTTPYFNFTYRSFTVELWFYPTLLTSGDYGLFGQCQSTTSNRCLIYMIRNYRLLLAFYSGK